MPLLSTGGQELAPRADASGRKVSVHFHWKCRKIDVGVGDDFECPDLRWAPHQTGDQPSPVNCKRKPTPARAGVPEVRRAQNKRPDHVGPAHIPL